MNFTEQQIRQMIRQEIQADSASSRYQLTPTNQHSHNGIDSPPVFQPILTYVGFVKSTASTTPPQVGAGEGVFPNSWKVTKPSTGNYTITHNLNSLNYSVVASASGVLASPSVTLNLNTFQVVMTSLTTLAAVDASFTFILVSVTNGLSALPAYQTIA